MQNLTRFVLISLLASLGCRAAACQDVTIYVNEYSGVHYTTRITAEQLAGTPEWRDDEPNPPLPVRGAILAARTSLKRLFDNEDKWELDTLNLHPIRDRWVYEVSFCPPSPPECDDCICFPFRVIVPMDGRIILEETSSSGNNLPISKSE